MEKGRTAILYFALRPAMEAKRKPIFPHHSLKVNTQFYQELEEELFSTITPLALPLVHIDDSLQKGDSFGDRITNAVEEVWSKGFDRVMILGNDCPELGVETYQRALELLDKGNTCLIPTQNGGAGLIAIHKKNFNASHWQELEWQSEHTFNELFDCLADCKVIDTTVTELNSLADAYAYLELHKHSDDSIAYLIDSILNPLKHFISLEPGSSDLSLKRISKLRGPPFKA